MTRSNAREIACHLVFEMNFNDMESRLAGLRESSLDYLRGGLRLLGAECL